MITSQHQLDQLISFIGRKKLKQLGLLPCTTCAHILWDVERLSNPLLSTNVADNELSTPSTDHEATEDVSIEVAPLTDLSPIVLEDTSHEPLGIGFIYNPFLTIPPHAIVCGECGRLYSESPTMHSITALPVVLSDVEYEILKGFYVDISL